MTTAYPLSWPDGWPRTNWDKRRNSSNFQTTFIRAKTDILDELRRLNATGAVISSWLPVNRDGSPRADQARRKIEDPGVAVYFWRDDRPFVLARDAFTNVHDNLRSIGLAVAGLRSLERHGGATLMNRAFSGFAALPPPVVEKLWWEVLEVPADAPAWMIEAAYKHQAKQRHPDAGGSDAGMSELNAARDTALKERP